MIFAILELAHAYVIYSYRVCGGAGGRALSTYFESYLVDKVRSGGKGILKLRYELTVQVEVCLDKICLTARACLDNGTDVEYYGEMYEFFGYIDTSKCANRYST